MRPSTNSASHFLPKTAACERAAPTEAQHGLTALEKEEESTTRTGAPMWIFPLLCTTLLSQ